MSILNWIRNQGGDTLVEVVFSIAILGSVLAGAYHISVVSFQIGVVSRERTQAVALAQQQAEYLRWYANGQMAQAHTLTSTPLGSACTAAAQCYMQPLSGGVTTLKTTGTYNCGSVIPTCTLYLATQNTINTDPNSTPSKPYPEVDELITVQWSDVPSNCNPCKQTLDVRIADTSNYQPLDCSVAGTPGCSQTTTGPGSGGAPGPGVPPSCPPGQTLVNGVCTVQTPFSWSIAGKYYASCVPAETVAGDGDDGCNPNSLFSPAPTDDQTAEYSRRDIHVYYDFNNSHATSSGTIHAATAAKITFNYRQYNGETGIFGSPKRLPPSGYGAYQLASNITKSGTSYAGPTFSLPISSNASSWSQQTYTTTFNVPVNQPDSIDFEWFNNAGLDPDLQIDSISIVWP